MEWRKADVTGVDSDKIALEMVACPQKDRLHEQYFIPLVPASYCFLPQCLTVFPSISLSADNVASSLSETHKQLGRNFRTSAHHVCSLPRLSIYSTFLAVTVWEQSVFSQHHFLITRPSPFLLTQGHHLSNFYTLSRVISFPLHWNIPTSTKSCGYFSIVKKKKVKLITS